MAEAQTAQASRELISVSDTTNCDSKQMPVAKQQIFALEAHKEHGVHPHPLSFGAPHSAWVGEQAWLVPLLALGPGRAADPDSWVQMGHSSPGCTGDTAACSSLGSYALLQHPFPTVPSSWVSTVTLSTKSSSSLGGRGLLGSAAPCWH